jgi:N-acetylmuramoyl-L-alanine amidase
MQRRASLVTQGQADLVLSIHMNEFSTSRSSGPQVFHRQDCPAGRTLSEHLQKAMNRTLLPAQPRDVNTGDYYILTLGLPSALVECGFLSNAEEEAKLRDPVYRAKVAMSICEGVLDWAGQDSKPQPLPAQKRP